MAASIHGELMASEGELSVTVLCCTNFGSEGYASHTGGRRKRFRVQVGIWGAIDR